MSAGLQWRRTRQLSYSVFAVAIYALFVFFYVIHNAHAASDSLDRKDAIIHRAWLDDPDNSITAQTALDRPWISFEGALSRGYTSGTTWLRIKIDPNRINDKKLSTDNRLVLRILPAHLDKVAIFFSDHSAQPAFVVGDRIQAPVHNFRFLSHSVIIEDKAKPFDLLLKMNTKSNHSIYIEALAWDDARDRESFEFIKLSLYIVFTSVVMIVSFLTWFSNRDNIIPEFIGINFVALILGSILLGAPRLAYFTFIPPNIIDALTSLLIPIYLFLMINFTKKIMKYCNAAPSHLKILGIFLYIPAIAEILIILGYVKEGLILTQSTAPIVAILSVFISARVSGDTEVPNESTRNRWRIYLIVVHTLMALFTISQAARVLGFRLYGYPNVAGFTLYSIMTTITWGAIIWYRARRREVSRLMTEKKLEIVSLEAAINKKKAVEQSDLVLMITHELKTPMSVVSLAIGPSGQRQEIRERAFRAIKNMKDVINSCIQMARFENTIESKGGISLLQIATSEALADAVALQDATGRVKIHISPDALTCYADPQVLSTIFGILLDNALKYGLPEECVHVTVKSSVRAGIAGVAFSVVNSVGRAGRPNPIQLFEKYYRSPDARFRSGTGLGLYLAKRLAVRLGGELSLLEDEKVRFELWLPA